MERKKVEALLILAFIVSVIGSLWIYLGQVPAEVLAKWPITTNEEVTAKSFVLVIDPGHGGFDGGAEASDGTMEKDINLNIAMDLKEEAEAHGVTVILTREDDQELIAKEETASRKRSDLLARKEIIEDARADLAVSIHLNSFPQDTGVYGAQVFYPKSQEGEQDLRTDEQIPNYSGRDYGEKVQKSIEINVPDGRERNAMGKDDILLFQSPSCPMILVECGFLSNVEEAKRLQSPEYQQQMASAIWNGINEILCLEVKEKLPVIDSTNKNEKNELIHG